MSPRAACRLERFGFAAVYDYAAGIADWKAAGLPVEGSAGSDQRVADATLGDVPTCGPDEQVEPVRERTEAAGWDECIVVDCGGVVVGRLRDAAWGAARGSTVGSAMEPEPTTVRPDALLAALVERMIGRGTKLVVVSTPQGELVGALLANEAARLLTGEAPDQIWRDCDRCPGRWGNGSRN